MLATSLPQPDLTTENAESITYLQARKVWVLVLQQAIDDLHSSAHRQDAANWFISDLTTFGSFRWVCTHLGYPYSDIRRKYKNLIYYRYVISGRGIPSLET